MRTLLYLGIDRRSAEFAAAVVGQAARDETVYIFGADAHRSDEINRYGLADVPAIARIGSVPVLDGEGLQIGTREVCVYQCSEVAGLASFKLTADAAAVEMGAE